jgi:hypothetical protein
MVVFMATDLRLGFLLQWGVHCGARHDPKSDQPEIFCRHGAV